MLPGQQGESGILLSDTELERLWRQTMPKFTERELLDIFPEAKKVIPQKLKEYEQKRLELTNDIKSQLAVILDTTTDEMSRWFWRRWLQFTLGEKLLAIEQNIARLRRQLWLLKGYRNESGLNDALIEAARAVSIEDLLNQSFRRSGKNLVGLCPFHEEKTPSFHIYTEQNRCWCFGCNQGGDVITVVEMLHGYDFKQAVESLTRGRA